MSISLLTGCDPPEHKDPHPELSISCPATRTHKIDDATLTIAMRLTAKVTQFSACGYDVDVKPARHP